MEFPGDVDSFRQMFYDPGSKGWTIVKLDDLWHVALRNDVFKECLNHHICHFPGGEEFFYLFCKGMNNG